MSEMFEKVKNESITDKAICNKDKTNFNTNLTNNITNPRENLNSNDDNDDFLCDFGENKEECCLDYFNSGIIELDEDQKSLFSGDENPPFNFDINPINNGSINLGENPNSSSLDLNDINNNLLKNSFFVDLTDGLIKNDEGTIQLPSFKDLDISIKDSLYKQKKEVKFCKKHDRRGRIPRLSENTKGDHTKKTKDNIETKVKVLFYESMTDYANELIEEYQSQNGNGVYCLLKNIDSKIKKQCSKRDNLKLLDNTVRDMLSAKISPKYLNFAPDYNKKVIDRIYREGKAKEVISFLDEKVLLFYNKFIEDDKKRGKFKALAYHIESLKKKEDEKYLESVVSTAKNFEENTRRKKSREKKKKKLV